MGKMIERYNIEFNPDVVKDLEKIEEKLKDESKKETIDPDKINKLRMTKLLRGMELTNGYLNNYRRGIPY